MKNLKADYIAEQLNGYKRGAGFMALCPAHADKNPSLSLKEATSGKILFHCFAGCSQDDVRDALIERGLWNGAKDE